MMRVVAIVLVMVLLCSCFTCLAENYSDSVPEKPVPKGMLAYWDEMDALIASAPTTVEEVNAVLAPFGLDCSNLSEMTEGVLTQSDIEHGRVDAEYWAHKKEQFALKIETYAYELLAYERKCRRISEENRFEVPPGIYTVGEDFPAGVYTIKNADGSSLFNISVHDVDQRSVFSDGFYADEGEYLGKIELLDGYTVKIDQGAALFAPYNGLETVRTFG